MTYNYDMESMIEAASLSSVTTIAANPPAHPNERQDTNNLPLVLYIARVPGSRDVFLTPIKPRDKVVTAYDVQNSLYFLHINSEDDYPSDSPVVERKTSANADASQLSAIYEKPKVRPPLPKRPAPPVSPPYPLDDPLLFETRPPSPPKQHGIARKPVQRNANDVSTSFLDLPQLPPRPLPTPPEEPSMSIHEENIHLLRRSEHTDDFNPYKRDYMTHPETVKQKELDARPNAGSLTLIRRDAGSNEQWNVATIHDPPVHEVSSSSLTVPTASRRTKKGGVPLYLDITNPGYHQYLTPSERTSPRPSTSSSSTSSDSNNAPPPPEGTFRRRLYMPGSQYGEHGYGPSRKHLSVSSLTSLQSQTLRSPHDRHHSLDTASLPSSVSPRADRRSKGYTFASPWDGGTCEFSTGATGKTLKLRHYLPSAALAQELSELRFNLPTGSSPTPARQKRSSYFSGRGRLASEDGGDAPSIVIDEVTGRIDLSLGQEKAGGGFGGKQAKLGKLIVYPEGLGMLDLLVAANLGLWWRAYERL